jgi:hypothetical protein
MNRVYQNLIGQTVTLELVGKKILNGNLIDVGSDIVVLFSGNDFVYVPLFHIKNTCINQNNDEDIPSPDESPNLDSDDELSLRKVLTLAKGIFTEIYVTGKQSLHGYIISIMNNYFIFYSPVYKMMFIPINHLKWLTPYSIDKRPFGLNNQDFPVRPLNVTLARSFDVQLEKLKGTLVVFNSGEDPSLIGKLLKVEDGFIELLTAREEIVYINFHHIQTVHQP